jgi:hypothetical protein
LAGVLRLRNLSSADEADGGTGEGAAAAVVGAAGGAGVAAADASGGTGESDAGAAPLGNCVPKSLGCACVVATKAWTVFGSRLPSVGRVPPEFALYQP